MIYYVSPTGNDNNAGTITAPFRNLQKLSGKLQPGDKAYVRGGTYTPTSSPALYIQSLVENIKGTQANPITIENYPGEKPVFDFTGFVITNTDTWAVYFENCSYLTIKGLRYTGLAQNKNGIGVSRGFAIVSSNNILIEQCEVDNMGGTGFLTAHSDDVTYLNCDSHHNSDPYSTTSAPYGGADGFAGGGGETSKRTVYIGCRAWWNSDDGFDFFGTDGLRTMKNCWSFWNGYKPGTFNVGGNGEGFKLGPTATNQSTVVTKIVTNCLAFENRSNGFSQNAGNSKYQLYNNTSYKNGRSGYWFAWYNTVLDLKNNIGFANPNGEIDDNGQAHGSNNSWNTNVTVSNADFQSVSSVGVDGPRQPDGSLTNLPFLKLVSNSDLIDKGVNVGLPYTGGAPDLGAYEAGNTPPNQAPTANAGTDKTLILPINSVTLFGSGSDVDGQIISYLWTKVSGPSGGIISTPTASSTTITNLIEGTYTYKLTVTDDKGANGSDEVSIVVNPEIVSPTFTLSLSGSRKSPVHTLKPIVTGSIVNLSILYSSDNVNFTLLSDIPISTTTVSFKPFSGKSFYKLRSADKFSNTITLNGF